MLQVETSWKQITDALRLATALISGFGYNRDTLTANNAVIPIAYYLLKKGLPAQYVQSERYKNDREQVRFWLTLSLVKRVFGGTPDTVLRPMREILKESNNDFPLEKIKEEFKGKPKSIQVTEDDLENFLTLNYGEGYTFSTLALLYPSLNYRNKFHIDHIFPKSQFTRPKLLKAGIPEDEIEFYLGAVNSLPNLQILEGIPNQEKSDSEFKKWLDSTCRSNQEKDEYMERHSIPKVDFSLTNFQGFIDARKTILREKLSKVLKTQSPTKTT